MEQILHGLHWKTLFVYLDNVIVISLDFDSHLQRLEEVFRRLQDAGLKLKPTKCELLQDKVRYLGHVVNSKDVAADPAKVEAIKKWKPLKDVKGLKAFLGTAGYYRQYLPDFATEFGRADGIPTPERRCLLWCSDTQTSSCHTFLTQTRVL